MRALVPLLLLSSCAVTDPAEGPAQRAGRARLAEERGDWVRAAELWHGLHDGRDPAAARGLARALDAGGDAAGALRVLAGSDAESVGLLLDRAALRERLGARTEALEDLERARALEPRSVPARTHAVRVLRVLGRDDEALALLREALALAPADPALWTRFAGLARETAASVEERGAYLVLAGLRPLTGQEALDLARLVLDEPEHHALAAAQLEAQLERDPSRGDGWRALAALRAAAGDEGGRAAALQQALEADPGDGPTLLALAEARASSGEWEALAVLLAHAEALGDANLVERLGALLALRPLQGEGEGAGADGEG